MLESLHFLLTYNCNLQCRHCFLHCGPRAGGTFTLEQVSAVLDQALELGSIRSVCFEGGEPTLDFPLLLAALDQARQRGLGGGIVTNAHWAGSVANAKSVLAPLKEVGLNSITLSDDALHYGSGQGSHRHHVEEAARELGMKAGTICVESPVVRTDADGTTHLGGGVMFRGRAAHELVGDLPRRPWQSLDRCTHEKLDSSSRVHLDCFGNVHLCQGLCMGNLWQRPLKQLVADYRPQEHPIVGPLLRGGPAQLVREHRLSPEAGYVDECHLCYQARRALRARFPELLAPAQVYGIHGD